MQLGGSLGELLMESGKVNAEQVADALELQGQKGGLIGELLVEAEACTDSEVTEALAAQVGMPFETQIQADAIDPALVAPFSLAYARQFNFVPLGRGDHHVRVAVSDPLELAILVEAIHRLC